MKIDKGFQAHKKTHPSKLLTFLGVWDRTGPLRGAPPRVRGEDSLGAPEECARSPGGDVEVVGSHELWGSPVVSFDHLAHPKESDVDFLGANHELWGLPVVFATTWLTLKRGEFGDPRLLNGSLPTTIGFHHGCVLSTLCLPGLRSVLIAPVPSIKASLETPGERLPSNHLVSHLRFAMPTCPCKLGVNCRLPRRSAPDLGFCVSNVGLDMEAVVQNLGRCDCTAAGQFLQPRHPEAVVSDVDLIRQGRNDDPMQMHKSQQLTRKRWQG